MSRTPFLLSVSSSFLLVIAAACSSSTSGGGSSPGPDGGGSEGGVLCTPGQQVSCACPGSSTTGAQTCASDGSGYGSCMGCPTGMDGSGSSSGGGADGSSTDAGGMDGALDDGGGTDGGGMDGAMPDGGCQQSCVDNNMAAYQKLFGYVLSSCGCQGASPCQSQCTTECANPSSYMSGSPCDQCISTQTGMGMGSACDSSAFTSCEGDSTCSPLLTCLQACP